MKNYFSVCLFLFRLVVGGAVLIFSLLTAPENRLLFVLVGLLLVDGSYLEWRLWKLEEIRPTPPLPPDSPIISN
jgi:hypothetical protein